MWQPCGKDEQMDVLYAIKVGFRILNRPGVCVCGRGGLKFSWYLSVCLHQQAGGEQICLGLKKFFFHPGGGEPKSHFHMEHPFVHPFQGAMLLHAT